MYNFAIFLFLNEDYPIKLFKMYTLKLIKLNKLNKSEMGGARC